jgi:hypothetical protein
LTLRTSGPVSAAAGARCWAVDGGRTGAAVAIADDGLTALWWASWRDSNPPELPVAPGAVVALEGTYYDPAKPSAHGALEGWYGELRGRLLATVPGVVFVRPAASQWRVAISAPANMKRAELKRWALSVAKARALGLPARFGADLAEAWGQARWCWAWDAAGRPATSAGRPTRAARSRRRR